MRLVIFTIALTGVLGCVDNQRAPVAEGVSALSASEEVRDIVFNLPHWAVASNYFNNQPLGVAAQDEYELAALKLQSYSSSEVRAGFDLALNDPVGERRLAAETDLFVLLRVLFNVPETIAKPSVQMASVYATSVQSPGASLYRLRWPVEIGSQGFVTKVSEFNGASGSDGGPLVEYDWFESSFGHRAIPSCLNRCGQYDASQACQCDPNCDQYGDCCVDLEYQCSTSTQNSSSSGSAAPAGGQTARPPLQ